MINALCDIATDNCIPIVRVRLDSTKAFSATSGHNCIIGIDEAQVSCSAEMHTILAHELGHCMTGAFYCRYSPLDIRSRHEYRADKWAVQELIPEDDLRCAMMSGVDTLWDLADYFDVTEDLIRKAFWIYFDKEL